MVIDKQKLELIQQITQIQNAQLINEIAVLLRKEALKEQKTEFRRVGWGKDMFPYVSDDFDDFIPPGFEEYLPSDEQVAAAQRDAAQRDAVHNKAL